MSVNNLAEQIIDGQVAYLDLDWNRQRALLLFLLGMEDEPISDFSPVEATEIELEYPLLGSNNFDFDVFFNKPQSP